MAITAAITELSLPTLAMAQTGAVVDGRVTETRGGPGIQNAIVRLAGQRPTLTAAGGVFRFEGVEPGEYVIQIEAFGYVSASRTVVVDGDATLILTLEIAPLQLDSLVVVPSTIELESRVRDAGRDASLPGADVLTSQGHLARTNRRGGFDFEVWEGVPIMVCVRAFGYLSVDTLLVPEEEDETYFFELEVDSLVERMIETEITRINARAAGRRSIVMRPLNQESLLRWDRYTLKELIRIEYPIWIDRIKYVLVDERQLSGQMTGPVLESTLARDVERIEFLFGDAMLRVYTREFMRTMLGSGIELRRATMGVGSPPLCT
jgi:hypothetical protein